MHLHGIAFSCIRALSGYLSRMRCSVKRLCGCAHARNSMGANGLYHKEQTTGTDSDAETVVIQSPLPRRNRMTADSTVDMVG